MLKLRTAPMNLRKSTCGFKTDPNLVYHRRECVAGEEVLLHATRGHTCNFAKAYAYASRNLTYPYGRFIFRKHTILVLSFRECPHFHIHFHLISTFLSATIWRPPKPLVPSLPFVKGKERERENKTDSVRDTQIEEVF